MDLATHFVREEVNVRQYQMHVIGKNLFMFDSDIRYETYKNEWYYGIIFHIDGDKYDIVHHYHMDWERLIINDKQGWKDIPFHEGTFHFLPEQIKVLKL